MHRLIAVVLLTIAVTVPASRATAETRQAETFEGQMSRGQQALNAGDLDAAVGAFEGALALRPGDPGANLMLGTALIARGDATEALRPLRAAAATIPDHHPIRVELARAYAALGRDDEAIRELLAAVELDPDDAATRARLASMLYRVTRLDEAVVHAAELARLLPTSPAVQGLLGAIELARGRHHEALAAFDISLALRPGDIATLYGRAGALHGVGRDEEAIEILGGILEQEPERADALMLLGDILAGGDNIESKIGAVDLYRRALVLRPDDGQLLLSLASLLEQAGLVPEAMALLEESETTATDPSLLVRLGRLQQQQEQLDAARATLERATQLGGGPEAWYRLGVLLINLAELDEAEAAYRHALRLNPAHVAAQRELGEVLLDRGQVAEAVTTLERVVAALPDNPRAWYLAGLASHRADDPVTAIERFRRALELTPDFTDALYNLGLALRDTGDTEGSRDALTRAQAARQAAAAAEPAPSPEARGQALLRDGYIRFRIGQVERAAEILAGATELLPAEESGWFYLGLAQANLGRADEAIVALERASTIRDRAETWELLGQLYEQAGRTDDAARAHSRAEQIRAATDGAR